MNTNKITVWFVASLVSLTAAALLSASIDFNTILANTKTSFGKVAPTQVVDETATEFAPETATPTPFPLIPFSTETIGEVSIEVEFLEVETVGSCGPSVLEAVQLAKQVAKEWEIPWSTWGPLIFSESSFHHTVLGKSGECEIRASKDDKGNPIAYGLAQVYPVAHPEFGGDKLKACLIDTPVCNLSAGAKILRDKYARWKDWDKAAAAYKGISPGNTGFESDPGYKIYKKAKDDGGVTDLASGTIVSFAESP
ncbi:MAG: transglycosylase SLT domain-containing protein [Patescibacteria group bacterium]